jgi:predicted metal-binding membrane protein
MSDMGEIPMPGGWMLSMVWTPVCGQTWSGAAVHFVSMWAMMMVPMMLPSLTPTLWRYRRAMGGLATLVGAGYFLVWTVLGVIVFALGAGLAEAAMQTPALARAVPVSLGIVVLLAGAYQFTAQKARHLARCRQAPGREAALTANAATAWRHGLRLGVHCIHSCAGLTALLLATGVMDLRMMAVVTAAITAERLAPAGERVARTVGAITVGAGVLLTVRAAWASWA